MATKEEWNDGIDPACCKSYYDLYRGTATRTYQSIGTRLNDDSSVNIMGDETTESSKPFTLKRKYQYVFNTEFNIALFRSKKDLFSQSTSYENSSQEEEIQLQQKYDDHQKEKNLSREVKESNIAASRDQTYDNIVACFDMEAVIPLPCGNVSIFFYKRKLNALNFTIYDATNDNLHIPKVYHFFYEQLQTASCRTASAESLQARNWIYCYGLQLSLAASSRYALLYVTHLITHLIQTDALTASLLHLLLGKPGNN
ncbi:hypothetical protein PR048_013966 [Dryococelus australis]|uniref:Uncharacterized protein n=1 Tax=Dryococelus australis TaxID=614101 RepID=A0ABQ9HTP8_9NEOP|nr:hypothetical protein PR048_013966 [Dryococelus australis]